MYYMDLQDLMTQPQKKHKKIMSMFSGVYNYTDFSLSKLNYIWHTL